MWNLMAGGGGVPPSWKAWHRARTTRWCLSACWKDCRRCEQRTCSLHVCFEGEERWEIGSQEVTGVVRRPCVSNAPRHRWVAMAACAQASSLRLRTPAQTA